jgi:hypothetical protein
MAAEMDAEVAKTQTLEAYMNWQAMQGDTPEWHTDEERAQWVTDEENQGWITEPKDVSR